ncbi:MAG: CapA family protein [Clostridia bacterium]|nr:CapA family protein [Clostridia bacterium]
MRHCRTLISILFAVFMLCLFVPSGAEEAGVFVTPEEAEEVLEKASEDEAADEAEVDGEALADEDEEEAEPLWLGQVKLAKSATIALRATMTTGNVYKATGSALKGEIVSVLEEKQQWAYVRSRDGEGYILLKFLVRVEPGTEDPTLNGSPEEEEPVEQAALPPIEEVFEPTSYLDTRAAFPAEPGETEKILLSFIGDVTLGCNEADHKSIRSIDTYVKQYGYDYPFRKVGYILAQDDLTVANVEGTFHSDSTGLTPQTKKAYNFRATPDFAEILKLGSVEAAALGNNHSIDYGEPGFTETVAVLEQNGIDWFGNTDHCAKSFIYEHNGVRIGFVSCYVSYWVINDGEHIPEINATIEDVKAQGIDVLIAYMHGGVEYDAKHDRHQERFAQYFINKGADIVIGSHPHRLQGCQMIDNVPVFYSLGNFVFGGNFKFFNKRHTTTIRYTAILQCALSFDENHKYLGCRFNIIPCRLGEDEMINQYQPFPVTGDEADACLKEFQTDTNKFWRLEDVQPDVGAMQMFIPARKK